MTNVNFFDANRNMSIRVAEFFRCVLARDEIKTVYAKKIATLVSSVENLDKLKGSMLADKIPELKVAQLAQVTIFEAERDKLLDEQAKFEYSAEDKAFKKAITNATPDEIAEAVAVWFDQWGLNVRDSLLMEEICTKFGYKPSAKTLCKSDGREALKFDAANALKVLYGVSYEHMVQVGTIKPAQIPEILRDKYAPKKVKKSNK